MTLFVELPGQLEAFLDRARAALDREIAAAKKAVAAVDTERRLVETALRELRDQHAQAEKQLTAVRADLQRASTRVGLDHEIAKARAELKRVKDESAKAASDLEARSKQIAEADARLVSLNNEAQRMVQIRVEGEAVMADLRAKVQSVQIRRQ
jgi:chromosome segregation ATPase